MAPAQAVLLAADSWLVEDGAVRAADAHWARFGDACLQEGVDRAELARFREVVTHVVPVTGRWFPRVELTARGLAVKLRPAPPQQATVRVVVAAGDPRTRPRRKGPDLETLIALRERGRAADGADEVLLCDPATGALREGALSSLLWWEDDALCTTPDEHTLPGVTRALLLALARERGIELRVRSPLPTELAGREVWLTSALHGIRAVSGWLRPAQSAGEPLRAQAWRDLLSA
ncbi:MAG TPA: aminotransferase class IV [Solirubrobacteraceae bacterium]|nr:aminotransferase class IV [Solirubrobacteraceae bacterium]